MDSHKQRQREPSQDSLVYSADSPDAISQLQEKVKSQAQRLRSLEQYKSVLEHRISEIYPGHPIPVLADMLGTGLPEYSEELGAAYSKILELEQRLEQRNSGKSSETNLEELYVSLHHQNSQLQKEKSALEESLRAEILACEESKTYIEVLKETIEVNIERLGLTGVGADAFSQFVKEKEMSDVNRRKSAKMHYTVKDQETQLVKLAQSLDLKTINCKELEYAKADLKRQLMQATEALQYAENEVSQLEQDKSELSKELEETKFRINILLEDLVSLDKAQKGLSEEHAKLTDRHNSEKQEKTESLKELENSRSEQARNERSLREVQQSFLNLKSRAEDKEQENVYLKEELNREIAKTQFALKDKQIISEKLLVLQAEIESLTQLLDMSKRREQQLSDSLSQTQSQLSQIQLLRNSSEGENNELKQSLENKTFECEELKSRDVTLTKQIEELGYEIEKLWNAKQEYYQRDQDQNKEINSLYERLNENGQNIELLLTDNKNLNDEVSNQREEIERYRSSLNNASEKRDVFADELRNTEAKLSKERSSSQYAHNELVLSKQKADSLSKELNQLKTILTEKEETLKESEITINSFNEIVKRLGEEIQLEREQRRKVNESYDRLNTDLDRLTFDKRTVEGQIESCCKVGSELTEKSRGIDLSKSFYEFLASWTHLPADLTSIQRWMQLAIDEILLNYEQNLQVLRENEGLRSQISTLRKYIEDYSREEASLKSKESLLKSNLDEVYSENFKIKEHSHIQISSLHQEIIILRGAIQNLNEDNDNLNSQVRKYAQELEDFREDSRINKVVTELKMALMSKQKRDYEDTFNKLWRNKSIESKRVFDELTRLKGDLERCESEKNRQMEQIILNPEMDLATKESVKRNAAKYDDQLLDYKKRLYFLENELIELEQKETRRKLIGDTMTGNESDYRKTRESSINSPYLESPRSQYRAGSSR